MFAFVQRICKIRALSRQGQQKGEPLGCCLWRMNHSSDSLLGQRGHSLMAGAVWLPASMPSGGSKRQSANVFNHLLFSSWVFPSLTIFILCNFYAIVKIPDWSASICWAQLHVQSYAIQFGGQDVLDLRGPCPRGAYSLSFPRELILQEAPYSSSPIKPREEEPLNPLRRVAKGLLQTSYFLVPTHPQGRGKEGHMWPGISSAHSPAACQRAPLLSCAPQCKTVRLPLCQGGLRLSYYQMWDRMDESSWAAEVGKGES